MRIGILILALLWLTPIRADDQVLKLLQELKSQMQDLKKQVSTANQRITDLENTLQQVRDEKLATEKAAVTASIEKPPQPSGTASANNTASSPTTDKAVVTVGDVKGTFKIPGTTTSAGFGGYIKTDLLLNSVSAGKDRLGDQKLVLSQIPVGGAPGEHSQMTLHAKESRLWFKSFTPSNWGDINTLIEMDFYGDAATYTYTPRLRHGYGSIGPLLAGQTWSTFLNATALPEHLDFGGSAGALTTFRQPQIRWSQPFNLAGLPWEWQAALEAPRSRIWVGSTSAAATANPNTDSYFTNPNADRYPDLVARLNFNPDWGTVSLAALGRQIRYTNSTGLQRDLWGGGINLSGKVTSIGLDNIRFMLHYGQGDGRYVSTDNTFSDASLDNSGHLVLTKAYGGMLSYQHWWDNQWRSTVTYSLARAEQPDFVNQVLNRQVQSLHANLLWSPVSQAMLGLEYTFANRELIDGRDGYLQRMQFSARYSF